MFFERGVGEDGPWPTGGPILKIAIIGAGPSGLVTAIALMKRLHRPFEAWLIDAEDAPGAFGNGAAGMAPTTEPARDLSVAPERPDDFADWLKSNWLADGTIATLRRPQDLHVPRALYRDYVMARFGEALSLRKDVRIRTFRGHVRHVDIDAAMPRLVFRDGECADFDHVFVATGFGVAQREAASWQAAHAAADRLSGHENPPPLTLVGNGPRLAAILLHLRANGYAGDIHVAAASGRLPQPHVRSHGGIAFGEPPAGRSLQEAFRYVRRECRTAEAREGGHWQAVVDAASARLAVVWRNLPQAERNRYRRHLLRLHRHFSIRLAADVHRRLGTEIETGRTRFVPPRSLKSADENTVDCREVPSARALAGLLSRDAAALSIDDGGRLSNHGAPVPALSVIGPIASSLRPGPFTFAETVRQAYRAVLAATPHGLARTSQP
ncbi:FAD/NAD(P)-binding protein [Shinella sp. CPCC 101442]|uniref:FAD/NAD(P)-binding protein n=1 Tax=Shinella sp. CPCC 101442 TaxID=2932265 RepID=UPI0021526255|nr:FAD/NAD(P)-binding protein [Shinella sp. CPCC 101442]MCR6499358.1 FAD/NAD(P)-binding protein [Shinella sp. CPCC 101442]